MPLYDTIIVGAGSAGCVLANRLTADPHRRVLLLEAGGADWSPTIGMPAALSLPMNNPRLDWGFKSEPEPRLDNRRLHCPRGKVLGGSSSINGMVYVRGHPLDYERWQALGARGWGYADVLPYFKRSETALGAGPDDRYRGTSGPLTVARGTRSNPLHNVFLDACEQAGYARSDDLNGYRQEGFGDLEMTVDRGVRCSTSRAYLRPARGRDNLSVLTRAQVERILLRGNAVRGVELRRAGGGLEQIDAQRVILAAGAIGSPQLLMLSGIGPAAHLGEHGIDVIRDVAAVGANLMDHLEIYLQYECLQPVSLNRWLNLPGKALIGALWLAARRGPGTTNHFETGGFLRSSATAAWPDVQLHFIPAAVSYDGKRKAAAHGFQVHLGPMASPSRGTLRLRSANPADKPVLRFNYMAHASDWQVFRDAIRHARRIISQSAFDAWRGDELAPGADLQSDAALDAFVARSAESAYHPCGTCRMGDDADAVVDAQGRVHGIDDLYVADSSVFPHITNGNLNAPTIMLAEKLSDAILGNVLAPDPLPFHTARA